MTEEKQVEKIVDDVLDKKNLDWEVAMVEQKIPTHSWNIEFEVPDGHEILISVPQGTPAAMKKSIEDQIEEELARLKSHR